MRKNKFTTLLAIFALFVSLLALTACQTNEETPQASKNNQITGGDATKGTDPGKEQAPDPADIANPTYTPSTEVRTTDDGNLLVIVNKEFAVSENYEPNDMVEIDGVLSTNQNLKVKKEAYQAYKKMLAAAQEAGLNFSICSAYRSYDLQKSLYDNSLATNGKEYTEKMFAYPGKSEHHTGYAIDVTSPSMNWGLSQDFVDDPDGAWITEHCSEYGFIIRYPKGKEEITGYMYEPWHIRYVGIEVAKYITQNGLTFEEYLGVA